MHRKYGLRQNTCGVYMIENAINHKKYIGASINVAGRFCEHLGRETKLYPEREFYKDIVKYGRDNFICSLLEECPKEDLLKREQYWYDRIHPEYNIFRPVEHTGQAEGFKEHQKKCGVGEKVGIKLKEKYSTPEYKEFFRENVRWKFKAVEMYDDSGFFKTFESLQECARWLNENTSFKGKNKTSKVKAVCDGERPTAYGYKYRYINSKCNDYPIGSKDAIDTHSEAGSRQ